MALTFTPLAADQRPAHVLGDLKLVVRSVTFDSSYVTGGELIVASDFGLNTIVFVSINAETDVATKSVVWLPSTGALKVWVEDAISGIAAEAANASNQSAVSVQVAVLGF